MIPSRRLGFIFMLAFLTAVVGVTPLLVRRFLMDPRAPRGTDTEGVGATEALPLQTPPLSVEQLLKMTEESVPDFMRRLSQRDSAAGRKVVVQFNDSAGIFASTSDSGDVTVVLARRSVEDSGRTRYFELPSLNQYAAGRRGRTDSLKLKAESLAAAWAAARKPTAAGGR